MRMLAGRTRLSWRILQGRPDYESGAAQEAIRAVTALRAPDQRVAGPTGLRQYGVPLAWLPRDVLSLAYSPSSELLQANDAVNEAAPYFAAPLTPAAVSHLATILDVQLFLFRRRDLDQALERSDRLLFENDVYAIVAAPTPSADARDGRVSRSTAREIVGASSIKA